MPQKKRPTQHVDIGAGASAGLRVAAAAVAAGPASARNPPSGMSIGGSSGFNKTGLSREEVHGLSRFVAGADDLPSMFGESEGIDWEPQKPEEVIEEARRIVRDRYPFRPEVDDSIFETRTTADRQDRFNRGYHIMLSDNRVRAMDDHFSRRVRSQLLGETMNDRDAETKPVQSARTPRKLQDTEGKPKSQKVQNPWYQHPKSWYSNKGERDNQSKSQGFPYDGLILKTEGVYGKYDDQFVGEDDGRARPLAKSEKETLQIVEAYRQYMKGNRLPHFLQ